MTWAPAEGERPFRTVSSSTGDGHLFCTPETCDVFLSAPSKRHNYFPASRNVLSLHFGRIISPHFGRMCGQCFA